MSVNVYEKEMDYLKRKIDNSVISCFAGKMIKTFFVRELSYTMDVFFKKRLVDIIGIINGKIEQGVFDFHLAEDGLTNEVFIENLLALLKQCHLQSLEQLKEPTNNKIYIESRIDAALSAIELQGILV